jgi:Ca2+-transporting ATPase
MPDTTTTPVPNAGAETGPGGLGATEAAARLRRDGPNALPEPERRSGWRVLRDVLAEPMLMLLLAAAGLMWRWRRP